VKKDLLIAVVVVIVVAVGAWVLNRTRGDLPLTPSNPFGGEKSADKKSDAKSKEVLHVNGAAVTESEFELFLQQAPEQARAFYASPAGRKALGDELVKLKLLEQEGRRMGIDKDPAVEAQIKSVTEQIVAGKTLEKLVATGNDAKLRAEYEKEKKNAVDLRHIILAYQGSDIPARQGQKAPSADAALARARGIVAQIRGGGDFATAAQQTSDDPQSAARGGSLGTVQLSQLPPEVAAVIAKLQPGQVSDPVKTQYGVHIFQASPPAFETMKPMLTERLKRELMEETMARLQKTAKIDFDPVFFPPQVATPPLQPQGGGQPVPPVPGAQQPRP
jgi:parvulin-like peptidyl-prolyl isomerase